MHTLELDVAASLDYVLMWGLQPSPGKPDAKSSGFLTEEIVDDQSFTPCDLSWLSPVSCWLPIQGNNVIIRASDFLVWWSRQHTDLFLLALYMRYEGHVEERRLLVCDLFKNGTASVRTQPCEVYCGSSGNASRDQALMPGHWHSDRWTRRENPTHNLSLAMHSLKDKHTGDRLKTLVLSPFFHPTLYAVIPGVQWSFFAGIRTHCVC